MEKFPQFSETGKFTLFLPVDSSFQVRGGDGVVPPDRDVQEVQPGLVDEEVVRGHLVPGHLLFSRPRRGRDQATAQYRSGLEDRTELSVVAKMVSGQAGPAVESLTLVGDTKHQRGLVTANIILGDISVNNGVIHLIDKPLVILTSSMVELVTDSNPRYRTFLSYLQLVSAKDRLVETRTLLVPTERAFSEFESEEVSEEMINSHLLSDLVLQSDIESHNSSSVSRDSTL